MEQEVVDQRSWRLDVAAEDHGDSRRRRTTSRSCSGFSTRGLDEMRRLEPFRAVVLGYGIVAAAAQFYGDAGRDRDTAMAILNLQRGN